MRTISVPIKVGRVARRGIVFLHLAESDVIDSLVCISFCVLLAGGRSVCEEVKDGDGVNHSKLSSDGDHLQHRKHGT